MRTPSALLLFLFLGSFQIFADPHDNEKGRYQYLGKFPIYSVPVRSNDTPETLDEVDAVFFSGRKPYAQSRPEPFYYKTDVDATKADAKLKDSEPFLIAGINCDDTIKQSKTISGVSVDHLNDRVKGHPQKAQFGKRSGPAWEGANNTHLRSSGDGFVKPNQNLRELLVSDNRLVRSLNLTHQKIAEPMLTGLEALDKEIAAGKVLKKDEGVTFFFNGEDYSISASHMGGHIRLFQSMTEEQQLEFQRARLARLSNRPLGTAWIGAGVQGSPFHDELFSDSVFTIKRKRDGKTLQKDALTPHLIHRYGFYQGGDYRVDPKEVADFFGLKGDQGSAWKDRGCIK